jgi:hypothetical protein
MQVPIGLGSNATIKIVTEKSEKVFTNLYKAKAHYVKLFKQGKHPRIVRIGEREKSLPVN